MNSSLVFWLRWNAVPIEVHPWTSVRWPVRRRNGDYAFWDFGGWLTREHCPVGARPAAVPLSAWGRGEEWPTRHHLPRDAHVVSVIQGGRVWIVFYEGEPRIVDQWTQT